MSLPPCFLAKEVAGPILDREKMYSQGGIFSITSRILIVDVLSSMCSSDVILNLLIILADLLNPETITGIVVLHADKYGLA